MATQTQKREAFLKLIKDPNKKLTTKYTEKIRLNTTPINKYSGLEGLQIRCTQYVASGNVVYASWGIKIEDCISLQAKRLQAMGFVKKGCMLSYDGFVDSSMGADMDLLRLIQNSKRSILCEHNNANDVVFGFLARIQDDRFTPLSGEGIDRYRDVGFLNEHEVALLERSLNLDGVLRRHYEYGPDKVAGSLIAKRTDEGYVIRSAGTFGYDIITAEPLTVLDLIRLNVHGRARTDILFRYLNLEIDNKLVYEDKRTPTDPLVLFNNAIAELQAKQLPLNELAKELILLSSKHLA